MKDVLILAEDKSLFEVIFCELSRMGYSVGEPEDPNCRLLFADADSKTAMDRIKSIRYKKLVLISREPEKISHRGVAAVLYRPVESAELRRVASELLADGEKKPDAKAPRQKKIVVDRAERTVTVGSKIVRLSEKEFILFCVLFEKRKECVLREELAAAIGAGEGNEVDVYVCYLRKKLEADGKRMIFTKRGIGYFLK